MSTSAWVISFAWLIPAVSVPGLIYFAGSMVRASKLLRRSPDDPIARFEFGWTGAFTLLLGLASCMSLALVLTLAAGSTWLAIAGLLIINLLVQPVAAVFFWIGVCKIGGGLLGHVVVGGRRLTESELAELLPLKRGGLAWLCVFQGAIGLVLGAAMSAGCASLLAFAIVA